MWSPSEPYTDPHNSQQVPSISYPLVLNNNSFFPTPQQFFIIFLYVLPTSLSIPLILLLFVRVLYFIRLLKTLSFLHWLIDDEVLKLLLVHFKLKWLFVYGWVLLFWSGPPDKFLSDEALWKNFKLKFWKKSKSADCWII